MYMHLFYLFGCWIFHISRYRLSICTWQQPVLSKWANVTHTEVIVTKKVFFNIDYFNPAFSNLLHKLSNHPIPCLIGLYRSILPILNYAYSVIGNVQNLCYFLCQVDAESFKIMVTTYSFILGLHLLDFFFVFIFDEYIWLVLKVNIKQRMRHLTYFNENELYQFLYMQF